MGMLLLLAKVIKSATAHHKKKPQTDEELETVLEDIAENEGIDTFCEQIIEELGKRP